jgi:hypothetical protein
MYAVISRSILLAKSLLERSEGIENVICENDGRDLG